MTKTGKPDSYWAYLVFQYAQGKLRFTTGKKPGAKKWKAAIKLIDECPLTPAFNIPVRHRDIFGKEIQCKCGYHKTSSGSTAAQSSSAVSLPSTSATQSSASATQSSSTAARVPESAPKPFTCTLCGQVVEAELFTEHLSDVHAEEACERCGKTVSGAFGLGGT